jgi:hypothetical protein
MKLNTQCTVCNHKARDAIDEALVAGRPVRHVATTFGLSKDAVHRHKRSHVDPRLATVVADRIEQGRFESLADQLGELRDIAGAILARAMQDGRGAVALAAMAEMRKTIEVIDKTLEREHGRQRARKLREDGGAITLRITYDEEGNEVHEHTFADVAALDTEIRKMEAAQERGDFEAEESEPSSAAESDGERQDTEPDEPAGPDDVLSTETPTYAEADDDAAPEGKLDASRVKRMRTRLSTPKDGERS